MVVLQASETSALGGQTETPDREDELDNHFICFVPVWFDP
jgi:hypothetical protein